MKISIITVAYNSERTIERTLQSIVNQIIYPYEYIIIDGASTDKTLEIVEKYREVFRRKKIHYIIQSERDNGIYDAMNKGIRMARGEYVAMLNSDDWYEPTTIKTVVEAYRKEKFDLAYGSIRYIGKRGEILVKKSRIDKFVSSRNWNHPSTFVKRKFCLMYPFNLKMKIYSDFNWFLRLRKENIKIVIFPKDKVIANFCIGGSSINDSFKSMQIRAKEKYDSYKENGYSKIYFIEAYVWEFMKFFFAKIYS